MNADDSKLKKTNVYSYEHDTFGDAGAGVRFHCPNCGSQVIIAENPWGRQNDGSCECGRWAWREEVVLVFEEARDE